MNESGKVHVGSRVVLWPQCCKQLELRFLSQQFPKKKKIPLAAGREAEDPIAVAAKSHGIIIFHHDGGVFFPTGCS